MKALTPQKPKTRKTNFSRKIIELINEVFLTDDLTNDDLVNYAYTVRDKVCEKTRVVNQYKSNTEEQAMLGDFPTALDDAILDSSATHENQKLQLLSDAAKHKRFAKIVYNLMEEALR